MAIITPLQIRGLNSAIGYGWRRFFETNYRSVIASFVMAAIVLMVSPRLGVQGYLHLICNIVVGALSYAVAYSVMHPRWPQEFKSVFTIR
jgi:hypothetical protein